MNSPLIGKSVEVHSHTDFTHERCIVVTTGVVVAVGVVTDPDGSMTDLDFGLLIMIDNGELWSVLACKCKVLGASV